MLATMTWLTVTEYMCTNEHAYVPLENWIHLFCHKASWSTGSHCKFLGTIHGVCGVFSLIKIGWMRSTLKSNFKFCSSGSWYEWTDRQYNGQQVKG
jgi:hypothetical protein